MNYFGNAFSLQMLDTNKETAVTVTPLSLEEVKNMELYSVVGHVDTANVLTGMLGKSVPFNRESIQLKDGDTLVVAQIVGGRLPEGTTTLPDGFRIAFLKVTCKA